MRVTRFKWLEITLFGFAVLLLLATFSRGGLLIAVVASALTFLIAGRAELRAAIELVHFRLSTWRQLDFASWYRCAC